jgi:acyl-CoA thioester hydrolase
VHKVAIKVRFNELDPYGHVNHSIYLQYFEEGRTSAIAQIGQSLDSLLANGFSLVVAQVETKFISPAYLSDNLTVESGITQIRKASAQWFQRITKANLLMATQKTRIGCIKANGNPCKFPDELAMGIKGLLQPAD